MKNIRFQLLSLRSPRCGVFWDQDIAKPGITGSPYRDNGAAIPDAALKLLVTGINLFSGSTGPGVLKRIQG